MSDDVVAMVEFLRARHAEGIEMAGDLARGMMRFAEESEHLPVSMVQAESRRKAHAAQARSRFFEESIVPYLGTAGPTGRIAEQQLRLLAWEHEGHPHYLPDWAP